MPMREVDFILNHILDNYPKVSDINVSVGRPFQVEVDIALQLDGSREPGAGGNCHPAAPGGRTGGNGFFKCSRIEGMTVPQATIILQGEISVGDSRKPGRLHGEGGMLYIPGDCSFRLLRPEKEGPGHDIQQQQSCYGSFHDLQIRRSRRG